MLTLLGTPFQGAAKQLLACGSGPFLQVCLPLASTAPNALRLPSQQCWLHSPAGSGLASCAHSYHGSRHDEDADEKDAPAGSAGQEQSSEAEGAVTRQMEAIQEAIQQAVQEGRSSIRDPGHIPEHVARHFMLDPLGMILSSQGVPMGISLKVNPQKLPKHRRGQLYRDGEADRQDWRELLNQLDSRPSSSTAQDQGTEVPRTEAQVLKLKCAEAANKLVSEERRTRYRKQQEEQQEQQASSSAESDGSSTSSDSEQHQGSPIGQQVKEQLTALMSAVDQDSWGTTQQSPAEIAQHIADSNRQTGGGSGGGDGDHDGGDGDDEPLELSPMEERYADQSAVAADLKEMDEIYEVLAKVPWLDDDDVDERELRGVVAVGLLGTLEEVGWQLRDPLLSLWAGERDIDKLTADVGPREAAALTAILYHTQQLEEQFNKPPAEGVAAALAAARGPAAAGSALEISDTHSKDGSK